MGLSHYKFGVKIFDSKFFHGKNRPEEILYKTGGSRLNRKIRDYKKDCRKNKVLPATVPFYTTLC